MNIKYLVISICLWGMSCGAQAATLNVSAVTPSVALASDPGATFGFADLGFDEGEVFAFGISMPIGTNAVPDGDAFLSFVLGFSISDPTDAGSVTGGFDVVDDNGVYLAGDLVDVGFRRDVGVSEGVLEFLFGNIAGTGAGAWSPLVLLEISLNDHDTDSPFSVLLNGTDYAATVSLQAVKAPSPVPLPAGGTLLLTGLGALALWRRRRTA